MALPVASSRKKKNSSLPGGAAQAAALPGTGEPPDDRALRGPDAAGKGGTIRRVTRYMNEKHYRVVALGRPTEEQRSQWYFQRYVAQFPTGGEMVLFDRPGTTARWWSRCSASARRGIPQLPQGCRRLREGSGAPGHHPGEALLSVTKKNRPSVRPPPRRSAAPSGNSVRSTSRPRAPGTT